jgi:hypothetical protein
MMDKEIEKLQLPDGYSVIYDDCVGFTFYDETKKPIIQHPYDNNSIRKYVWDVYKINKSLKTVMALHSIVTA